jgi:hypothetical protein
MSRAEASPAGRTGLLDGLVDDAAVFPPGLAGWDEAVAAHVAYRHSSRSPAVGPLLVPAGGVDGLLDALTGVPGVPVPLLVGLVSRDGVAPAQEAAARLAADGRTRVVAVELPLATAADDLARTWRQLSATGAAVWWELDRDADPAGQLDRVAAARGSSPGGAKLRTGGTDAAAVAPVPLLAAFLVGCAARALPFKLTAGLHHAVRGPDPVTGGTTHGVLDVLLATRAAVQGADDEAVAALLVRTDADGLARDAAAMTPDEVGSVRALWASFGCCGVLDPLGELDALGVR